MRDNNSLSILQYNVRNDRVSTMIPLLADEEIKSYDIIAIQEPWRNPHAATSLSSYHSGFHLLFRPGADTRVCFYITDQIDPDSWEIEYPTPDLSTLTVKTLVGSEIQTLRIHNVYNPSPTSYSSRNGPSTLPDLARQLLASGEHIVLGDFNLHHPYWSGPTRLTQHAAADTLIDVIDSAELSLTLLRGSITWEARGSQSIIDLIFMSETMASRLVHCMTRADMGQSSDHIPVSTRLCLGSEPALVKRRRAWKLLDMEKLREAEKNAPSSRTPQTIQDIEHYTEEIRHFLQTIIEVSVPWVKTYSDSKPH